MNFATSNCKSKTKQRERPKGCIIFMHLHAIIHHLVDDALSRIIYLHRRGAFSVARFDLQGNAKAYRAWNGQMTGSTLFGI